MTNPRYWASSTARKVEAEVVAIQLHSGSEDCTCRGGKKASSDSEGEAQNYAVVNRPRGFENPECNCCNKGSHLLHSCYKFVHNMSVRDKKLFAEKDGRASVASGVDISEQNVAEERLNAAFAGARIIIIYCVSWRQKMSHREEK